MRSRFTELSVAVMDSESPFTAGVPRTTFDIAFRHAPQLQGDSFALSQRPS